MIADLHTHTALCKHAAGTPEDYFRAALKNGLSVYGLADHSPWPDDFDTPYRMSPVEYPEYRRTFEQLKEAGKANGLEVLFGLEVECVPGRIRNMREILDPSAFDYLIGSIHFVDDFAFDDHDAFEAWKKTGRSEVLWEKYLLLMRDFVSAGGFDILGHADLPKKYGCFPAETPAFCRAWHEIFEIAAEKNIAVELNTNGLTRPARSIYPSLTLLKIAKEHGIRLTYGSDAHSPECVGAFFNEAVELAEAAGFSCFHLIRKHQLAEVPFF